MKNNIVIVGSSGHAKVIIDIVECQKQFNILGLLDDYKCINETVLGYNILGKVADAVKFNQENKNLFFFVAIGDNWIRHLMVEKLKQKIINIRFANIIHPTAQIGKNTSLGQGIALMANTVVNSNCEIGNHVFLNTKSSADHDNILKDFSSLGPNTTLGGNVILNEFSAISISATVKEKITIGKHSVIGAGSLLLINCPDFSIMYGSPAKYIRQRVKGEKYL